MKLFIYHIPSGQGFSMKLYKPKHGSSQADTTLYELVEGRPNAEIQEVPEVAEEIKRTFGDQPHFLDIQTTVYSELRPPCSL